MEIRRRVAAAIAGGVCGGVIVMLVLTLRIDHSDLGRVPGWDDHTRVVALCGVAVGAGVGFIAAQAPIWNWLRSALWLTVGAMVAIVICGFIDAGQYYEPRASDIRMRWFWRWPLALAVGIVGSLLLSLSRRDGKRG
jgi:hypothetical protein